MQKVTEVTQEYEPYMQAELDVLIHQDKEAMQSVQSSQ